MFVHIREEIERENGEPWVEGETNVTKAINETWYTHFANS